MRWAILLLAIPCAANAQNADPALKFEVASIKVAAKETVDPHVQAMADAHGPSRFTRHDIPLNLLIMTAYRLNGYQFSGPSWLNSERFDIIAKVPDGATQAQQSVMLQNLLAERFGLKVHREPREMQVYDLVIAKGGIKFKEAVPVPPGPSPNGTFDAGGIPVLPPGGGTIGGLPGKDGTSWGVMHEEITMERLARIVGSFIGSRPVRDATGLTGKYDLAMHWPMHPNPADDGAAAEPADGAGAGVFAALQSQLGLKLEAKKGMVEVLVVDHCEKMPTEN